MFWQQFWTLDADDKEGSGNKEFIPKKELLCSKCLKKSDNLVLPEGYFKSKMQTKTQNRI